MCVADESSKTGLASRFKPSRFPKCVANSRPPAPPPTTRILCSADCIFSKLLSKNSDPKTKPLN